MQQQQLSRVSRSIAEAVVTFCAARLAHREKFFSANELRERIAADFPSAPGSSDRILRDLRKRGIIGYTVVSRAASLYRIDSVRPLA